MLKESSRYTQTRRASLCGLGFLLLVFTLTDDCCAQWKKIFDKNPSKVVAVIAFNKWGVGFLGLTDRNHGYTSSIWKSLDTGQSWVESVSPFSTNGFITPNDFTFKDSLTGWMAADEILKTT